MTDPTSEYRDNRPDRPCCPDCGADLPLGEPDDFSREVRRRMEVEAAYAALGTDCANLAAANARLREALAFARSVIKSGESWTDTCERVIGGALA